MCVSRSALKPFGAGVSSDTRSRPKCGAARQFLPITNEARRRDAFQGRLNPQTDVVHPEHSKLSSGGALVDDLRTAERCPGSCSIYEGRLAGITNPPGMRRSSVAKRAWLALASSASTRTKPNSVIEHVASSGRPPASRPATQVLGWADMHYFVVF
jgi:hypothetical protein